MAPVSAGERGQLILVAGLSLAVVLVVLALVLNTAIYTENVASRDVDSGATDALAARDAAVEGAGAVVDGTNDRSTAVDYGTLEDEFEAGVGRWSTDLSGYAAFAGRSLRVSPTGDASRGVRIVDGTSSSAYTPIDGSADWTVAPTVHVRSFEMTVTSSASAATAKTDLGDGTWDDDSVFSVDFGAADWRMAVYENSSSGDLTLAVDDGDWVGTCSTASSELRIDVGRGTVNGVRCEPLTTAASVDGPIDVRFANGDAVTGTYELTVDRAIDGAEDARGPFADAVDRANADPEAGCSVQTYNRHGDGNRFPTVAPALYAGAVDVSYRAESIAYDATARVAPGEIGAAATTPRISSYAVDDRSNSTHVAFVVDWSVADPDGDLASVTVALDDTDGTEIRRAATPADGSTASGSTTVAAPTQATDIAVGTEYDVRVAVEDATGEVRSVVQRHVAESDGDDAGCPP